MTVYSEKCLNKLWIKN